MSKNNGTINTCCGIINEDNSTMKRVFLKGNLSFANAYADSEQANNCITVTINVILRVL